jgi:Stress responsive A/B Barrel Domain
MSRFAACAVLFAVSCLFVAQRAEPVGAQDKKDPKKDNDAATIAKLQQQLKAAQVDLQQAAIQFNALKVQNAKQDQELNRLQGLLKKEKGDDKKDDKALKDLRTALDNYRGAGLIHVVVLKLKPDSAKTEAQSVIDDTYSQLAKIKTVRGVWAGKPSAKAATAETADYTVALVFVFDDAAGLKSYLSDPIHTKFADKHLPKWETPLVYDFEPKKLAP